MGSIIQEETEMYVFLILAVFPQLFLIVSSESVRERLFMNGPCFNDQFRCLNDKCIEKGKFCDGSNDCGDASDENYCRTGAGCPNSYPFYRCKYNSHNYNYYKCIPAVWKCDGNLDCYSGEDEICNIDDEKGVISASQIRKAKNKAIKYIVNQRNSKKVEQKWGTDIPRKTIAVYMLNNTALQPAENVTHEIPYELSICILSRLALNKMEHVSTSELAHFVNALLVSCIDPKAFHVVDLVKELRKRVDAVSTVNPYAFLALCNAKEIITEEDVAKLIGAFNKANSKFKTDTQALIIMALACAANQPQSSVSHEEISDLTLDIKKRQYRNGTVENTKTTALVLQALFASEPEPDKDNFDEAKAIKHILDTQEADGSFGNFLNTYYIIPILSYSSLVNISNAKCPSVSKDEDDILDYLKIQLGEKMNVKYSFWIGDEKTLRRSMTLRVPYNTSFYTIMEYAVVLDDKYKFQYNMRNRKPYLYTLSGIMDDAENEMFWQLFYLTNNSTEPTLIDKSPADVIPENNDHLIYWYKKGM